MSALVSFDLEGNISRIVPKTDRPLYICLGYALVKIPVVSYFINFIFVIFLIEIF